MKTIFFLLTLFSFSFSSYYVKLIDYYKNQQYLEACKVGVALVRNGEKNDEMISLIGDSCAKVDYINFLCELQKHLTNTKASRENSSYFANLILQKRLIFQFLFDDLDLSNLKLPKTEHILSKVFINLSKKNYVIISQNPKKVKILDGEKVYLLYYSYHNKKVYIDEMSHSILIKKHRFS